MGYRVGQLAEKRGAETGMTRERLQGKNRIIGRGLSSMRGRDGQQQAGNLARRRSTDLRSGQGWEGSETVSWSDRIAAKEFRRGEDSLAGGLEGIDF